jgi:hypothetical protein
MAAHDVAADDERFLELIAQAAQSKENANRWSLKTVVGNPEVRLHAACMHACMHAT